MTWSLVLITAMGIQSVGQYSQEKDCQAAAKVWQTQQVKAGCVQQESPEQTIARMQQIFKTIMESMPK